MKLIKFNAETLPKSSQWGRKALPAISISKSGVMSLNKPAAELLKCDAATKLSIAQDPDEPKNWYVFKEDAGYEISPKVFEKAGTADFCHKGLQAMFCEAMELNAEKSHRYLLAGEATKTKGDTTEYFGILIP